MRPSSWRMGKWGRCALGPSQSTGSAWPTAYFLKAKPSLTFSSSVLPAFNQSGIRLLEDFTCKEKKNQTNSLRLCAPVQLTRSFLGPWDRSLANSKVIICFLGLAFLACIPLSQLAVAWGRIWTFLGPFSKFHLKTSPSQHYLQYHSMGKLKPMKKK